MDTYRVGKERKEKKREKHKRKKQKTKKRQTNKQHKTIVPTRIGTMVQKQIRVPIQNCSRSKSQSLKCRRIPGSCPLVNSSEVPVYMGLNCNSAHMCRVTGSHRKRWSISYCSCLDFHSFLCKDVRCV